MKPGAEAPGGTDRQAGPRAGQEDADGAAPAGARPATRHLLVTGGSGMVGSQVCRLLAERGRHFVALVRAGSEIAGPAAPCARIARGDLLDPPSLYRALDGVSQVVHLAGVVHASDPAEQFAVHAGGTRNLLDAAERAGVRRVVALSSDSVTSPHRSPYAQSKARAEALLREWAARDAGRELVILRPPMILGPGSAHLALLRRLSRLPVLPLPPGALRRPVWVGDVAEAVLAALDLPSQRLPREPISLAGPDALRLSGLIRAVARSEGRRPPMVVPVPGWLAAALAEPWGEAVVARVRGLAEEFPADDLDARELLGWRPAGVGEALRFLRAEPDLVLSRVSRTATSDATSSSFRRPIEKVQTWPPESSAGRTISRRPAPSNTMPP